MDSIYIVRSHFENYDSTSWKIIGLFTDKKIAEEIAKKWEDFYEEKMYNIFNEPKDWKPTSEDLQYGGEWYDYYPNSGIEDYTKQTFEAKVLDCSIDFHHDMENDYYTTYTYFSYVLLLESLEDVLKDNPNKINKLVYTINGYDPEFEKKFDKGKYDDMNYYEIEL